MPVSLPMTLSLMRHLVQTIPNLAGIAELRGRPRVRVLLVVAVRALLAYRIFVTYLFYGVSKNFLSGTLGRHLMSTVWHSLYLYTEPLPQHS